MRGSPVLWVPGCDHAGIATQVRVEQKLWADERKTRHDIGRQAFVERVMQWKDTYVTASVTCRMLTWFLKIVPLYVCHSALIGESAVV